jgi:hypothetical protein
MEQEPVKQWGNIAASPIHVGDWIIFRDEENEEEHTFEVTRVDNPDGDIRPFKVKVLQSTNKTLKRGTLTTIKIDRTAMTWGAIIRYEDRNKRFSQYELNDLAAYELRKWLDTLEDQNYRAKLSSCITFLRTSSIFPQDEPVDKQKVRLREIIKQRTELMWSRGGYVGSTGLSYRQVQFGPNTAPNKGAIEVDFRKFAYGCRLILEAFSIFKLKNVD